MPRINVAKVISNPKLAENFIVYRKSLGTWIKGEFVQSEDPIPMYGVVTVATPMQLEQVPAGDRIKGVMCFHSTTPIYMTQIDNKGTSDEIVWKGKRFRTTETLDWGDFGYYKALGVRMAGS